MSKVLREFEKIKQKRDDFKQKQEEEMRKRIENIKCGNNLIKSFAQMINEELQRQISELDGLSVSDGPYLLLVDVETKYPYMPYCEWLITCDGFSDGFLLAKKNDLDQIVFSYRNEFRFSDNIFCTLHKEGKWKFTKHIEIENVSKLVENILLDALNLMSLEIGELQITRLIPS